MLEKELVLSYKLDVKNEEGLKWGQKCFKKEFLSLDVNTEIFMDEMISCLRLIQNNQMQG